MLTDEWLKLRLESQLHSSHGADQFVQITAWVAIEARLESPVTVAGYRKHLECRKTATR